MEDQDQSLIDELTHMATIYKRRGHVDKADEIMRLAEDIAARRNASPSGDSAISSIGKSPTKLSA